MPAPVVNKVGGLDSVQLDDLRSLAQNAVDSLRNDLSSVDEKVRAAARKELFNLGVFQTTDANKGVVAFLLERAKKGDFGKKAAVFARESTVDPNHVDFKPGEAIDDDDPDTVRVVEAPPPPVVVKEARPVMMAIPDVEEEKPIEMKTPETEALRKKLLARHDG